MFSCNMRMHDMHYRRTSPAGMRGMAALSQARSSILPTVLPIATTTGANNASTVGTCSAPEERTQREHKRSIRGRQWYRRSHLTNVTPAAYQQCHPKVTSSGALNIRH